MKKLAVLVSAVFLLSCAELTGRYGYSGDVDPNEFMSWSVIGRKENAAVEPVSIEILRNPDEKSEIRTVMAFVFGFGAERLVIGYAYEKNGSVSVFRLNAYNTGYDPCETCAVDARFQAPEEKEL